MKKIGILGSGMVAKSLGNGFIKYGYEVMLGSRDTAKLEEWKTKAGANARTGSMEETASFGEIIVLAVKGEAAEPLIKKLGPALSNKTVIDTTNPIDHERTPKNGVLPYFTTTDESLMQRLQKALPGARFVKAFNSVGNQYYVDPQFRDGKPTMFICGNEDAAKAEVTAILEQFGWETEDMGKMEAAGAIEALCILWCIPGFLQNSWSHAFKLLKQ